MASVSFAQNTYAGEVLEDLLTYTAQGNDTYKEGLIHIKSGIQYKYTLPSVSLGDIIQDNKPTPTSPTDSKGTYTFRERYLEPKDFMVYLEFNPRDFEKYWKFAQPDGNLVFRELDPKVQATMLRLLMDKKNAFIGDAIWQSVNDGTSGADGTFTKPENGIELGSGSYKYFDGAIYRILKNLKENVSGETVINAGDTELKTGENIESAMYTMWQKCPYQIRKNNLVYIMDWGYWDLYDQYVTSKQFKYNDNTQVNKYMFKGKRIVPIVGIPESTIVLGNFSTGMDSNLWMGVDYANDTEVLKIDRLQANSELYFFQMKMKMDVNIVRPAEIVVWTAYKLT